TERARVAGPRIAPERQERGIGQLHRAAGLRAGPFQEPGGERGNVVASLAQRRQAQHQALEPEVEILAKPSLGDAALEIAIAGGDDPDVHRHRARRADLVERLLLKHAQELALMIRSQLADLVEEQRSSIGLLEVAPTFTDRPGEAALDVTEELSLEELGRNGRHVDCDERLIAPRTQGVGRPGEQLLARARLAADEDRQRRWSGSLEIAEQRQYIRITRDDAQLGAALEEALALG